MNKPTLAGLAEWMDADLVKRVDDRRRKYCEIQRDRKLGTIEMLWLMLQRVCKIYLQRGPCSMRSVSASRHLSPYLLCIALRTSNQMIEKPLLPPRPPNFPLF